MAARVPPFHLLLLAQSASACSEIFGQRLSRRGHHGSNIRMLVSMSIYCCVQAFLVLAVAEVALPTAWTGGQGSLSMWRQVVEHPGLLINAVNNSVYWAALAFLLREPLGAILVVLAFLFASFLVDPISTAVGLPAANRLTADAVCVGIVGALLCVIDLPLPWSTAAWAACRRACKRPSARVGEVDATPASPVGGPTPPHAIRLHMPASRAPSAPDAKGARDASDDGGGGGREAESETRALLSLQPSDGGRGAPASARDGDGDDGAGGRHALGMPDADAPTHGTLTWRVWWNDDDLPTSRTAPPTPGPSPASSRSSPSPKLLLSHAVSVMVAYAVLAVTTGIGVVVMAYFQAHAGLTSFGYTAIDQVLLPFTTLPMAAVLDASQWGRALIGEPAWGEGAATPPHFGATLRRTWVEVNATPDAPPLPTSPTATGGGLAIPRGWATLLSCCRRPWPMWATLVPFHGLEFSRSLLFFYLVTAFDVDATYASMTMLRIVLCWMASLLACSTLRRWVGLTWVEARTVLQPVNLALKLAGSAFLLLAILRLNGTL